MAKKSSTKMIILPTSKEELPSQIVMDFFAQGIPITHSPKDIAVKKSNGTIKMNSNFNLLELKIIDASLLIAKPNMNENTLHSADIEYFKWLLNYNSQNHDHLKRCISKIQQTLIQFSVFDSEDHKKDKWHSTAFLHEVTISNGRIYFRIPESLRESLANPHSYTYLSLKIKNMFTSEYAYRLYEQCKADQFKGGATDWLTIDEFRKLMNVKDLYPQFQDLNKRVIQTAMQQINEHSDIFIVDAYQTRGRTKTHIRFVIEDNPNIVQFSLDKEKLPIDIFNALKSEFGLSNSQIDDLSKFPADFLAEKIEFTRYRIKTSSKEVKRPDAYLLKAINEDLNFNKTELDRFEAEKKQLDLREAESRKEEETKIKSKQNNTILDEFLKKSEDEQKAIIDQFKQSEMAKPLLKVYPGNKFTIKNRAILVEVAKFLKS